MMILTAVSQAEEENYVETVSHWTSYEEVGKWLQTNFKFNKDRQKLIQRRLRKNGPQALQVQNPAKTFTKKSGYCADAANFALDALNRINPQYNARLVFIKNKNGPPHHWATGFTVNSKLYIMDYGAGRKWRVMNGIHGPYNSLAEYVDFLASLRIKGFAVATARWREMPGEEE